VSAHPIEEDDTMKRLDDWTARPRSWKVVASATAVTVGIAGSAAAGIGDRLFGVMPDAIELRDVVPVTDVDASPLPSTDPFQVTLPIDSPFDSPFDASEGSPDASDDLATADASVDSPDQTTPAATASAASPDSPDVPAADSPESRDVPAAASPDSPDVASASVDSPDSGDAGVSVDSGD
jgi:hypothetical protein